MPWLPVIHFPDEELEFFRNQVLPDQTVIVADNMDQLAGFAAYTHGWLNHLYVAPDAWRDGIGSELLAGSKPLPAACNSGRSKAILPHAGFMRGSGSRKSNSQMVAGTKRKCLMCGWSGVRLDDLRSRSRIPAPRARSCRPGHRIPASR
ncbi:GNAT family N-acetyltransferase [Hyphomonas sp. L-53-1-40]|uniref:GNAT family N-acetyltransferase n=1 Tax=Hyphomonas sp. L-53-1-40 TaxID=1207058 RepID=UPI0009FF5F93